MIGTLLSILTGGGLVGGLALLVLRPALRDTAFGLLRSIPPRMIWAIAAMAAIFGAVLWHNHTVTRAYERGKAAGGAVRDTAWKAAFDEMHRGALLWKRNYEAEAARRTQLERQIHVQNLSRNSAAAGDLRLRGPGRAAACRGPGLGAGISARTGGHDSPVAPGDAPGTPLPAGDGFAVVPWGWIVERAKERDDLLSEALTWRSWYYDQQRLRNELIKKYERDFPKPAF